MKTLCETNGLLGRNTVHVMLDAETWGVTPGAAVSTIGAVRCPGWPVEHRDAVNRVAAVVHPQMSEFSVGITLESALLAGLVIDPETVAWWQAQPEGMGRQEMEYGPYGVRTSLKNGLERFTDWLADGGKPGQKHPVEAPHYLLWGNGAASDPVWLEAAFRAAGVPVPWKHWQVRCFRTLKALCEGAGFDEAIPANDSPHVARRDAAHQMQHLQQMLEFLRGLGKVWPVAAGEMGNEEVLERPTLNVERPTLNEGSLEDGEIRDKKGRLIAVQVMGIPTSTVGGAV